MVSVNVVINRKPKAFSFGFLIYTINLKNIRYKCKNERVFETKHILPFI